MTYKTRKRTVQKIVDRHGGGTSTTNLWELLDKDVRKEIKSRLDLPEGDDFLFGSFNDVNHWCLVTVRQVFLSNGGNVVGLPWPEIQEVDIKQVEWDEMTQGKGAKGQLRELVIQDRSSHEHRVFLDAGPGFLLVWSVLVAFTLRRKIDG